MEIAQRAWNMSLSGQDNLHDSFEISNPINKRRFISQALMPTQEHVELLQKQEEEEEVEEEEEDTVQLLHTHRSHAGNFPDRNHNSGSDVSAAYFSGDSDLTAEQMGSAEEDGSKSSNSDALPLPVQSASQAAGTSQTSYPDPQHHDNINVDDKEERQASPISASRSTSTAAVTNQIDFPESEGFSTAPTPHLMHGSTAPSCSGFLPEYADSDLEESWLELRLGCPSDQLAQPCGVENIETSAEKSGRNCTDEAAQSGLVTLQLLPENPKLTEHGTAVMKLRRSPMNLSEISAGSSLCGSIPRPTPSMCHPSSAALSAMMDRIGPRFEEGFAVDQRFVVSQSNDPPAAFHQWRAPRSSAGFSNDQAQTQDVYADRSFLHDSRSSEIILAAPMARPTAMFMSDVQPPTAILGWPSGGGSDARWYLSRTMATEKLPWKGIVRDSATEMQNTNGVRESGGGSFEIGDGRRRNITTPPSQPPSGHSVVNQRLRLATSPKGRRNAGLWLSLEAARSADNDEREELSTKHKIYLRMRDGKMQVSVLKKYLMSKLRLSEEDEVEITCRGKLLVPTLTIEHVRDKIWLSKELQVEETTIGFRSTNSLFISSQDKIMTLCYQTPQTITLNLLKT